MDSSDNDLRQNTVLLGGTSSQIEENKVTSKENLRGLTVEEQQQNILRQVQATRAERTKHELVTRHKNTPSDNRVKEAKRKESTASDDELHKEEIIVQRAAEKLARIKHRQTRGPRTKGVLFKRLSDNSLVNVDLIKRSEERELRKKRKQELKQKQKERKYAESNSKTGSKDTTLKHQPDQKEQKVDNKESKTASPSKFVPAPAPAKSAWSAGPPAAIKKVQEEPPTAIDTTTPRVNSTSTSNIFPHIPGESSIDDVLSCNLLDIDKTVMPNSSSWNPSSTSGQQQRQKLDKAVNVAVGPIMSSWSEFSGGTAAAVSEAFQSGVIPSTQPISSRITTNNKDLNVDEIPHPMNSFQSSSPTHHEDDSDDVIGDADFALPRDLLNGVEGEDHEVTSIESSLLPSSERSKEISAQHSKSTVVAAEVVVEVEVEAEVVVEAEGAEEAVADVVEVADAAGVEEEEAASRHRITVKHKRNLQTSNIQIIENEATKNNEDHYN
eukprot:CAMPEP_0204625864 /NCGR_PEP_ID=MMETSP0717-20131115/11499_1 /ASSEMBLY_ACC=CAM_ASM_000666 /TAXON_ID=230516 /ORGANISM="Chaetoceros curvisetus" /LENGTH=495 /DNA_ID=CAMNT_0051641651 /DNA_START=41 /DNA_END=1526 /DNA_ORIENTATION=-